jgi:hypothetical protein
MNERETKQPAAGREPLYYKQDSRPQRGWWAPGLYMRSCIKCHERFLGDKRAGWCADCAYREAADESAQAPVEGQIARSCSATGYPLRSADEFAGFLAAQGIIDECAYYDAEGYDGGAMMARVSRAWRAATDNS